MEIENQMPNLAVKRDCAKARSPLLLRWASQIYAVTRNG